MWKSNMQKANWAILLLATAIHSRYVTSAYVSPYDLMKCAYGERGSLTATCINATASYFKNTPYRFDQLDETLRCANCSLETLDSGTFDISGNQIKNLDLTKSKIATMRQKAFVGLIFLENLILRNNSIRSIYPGTFTGVKKIKSIDLSNNNIGILSDDGFLELLNLETLNLEYNSIQTIAPRAFNGLINLKVLNLKNNEISDLRNAFSNLTSLQVLNLENNKLVTIVGTEFSNLTSLLELNLAFNKLLSPTIIFEPAGVLKNLFLQNNFIDRIAPKFLSGVHYLENLDLSNNQINELNQKTLQSLYKLINLNLSHNKLAKFQTGTFSGLPQLEVLNCSHNNINDIEITGVFSLHSLHSLDLSNNIISDLDYVGLISRMPRLSYLRLENNKLPCDLEDEMFAYFAEDNFKFVLYDNSVGSEKCVDAPSKKFAKEVSDVLVKEPKVQTNQGTSGAEITIIILISILFVCIGFLFYLQYRTYQETRVPRGGRAMSTANLMDEPKGTEDFLRE